MAGRKRFAESDQIELKVVDEDGTIGTAKVKPNGVGWKKKNKQRFLFVDWDVFEKFLDECKDARELE